MAIPPVSQRQDVASIANRILVAWKSGPAGSFEDELRQAARLNTEQTSPNSLEREKMEVLDGVVQLLKNGRPRPDAGRAAMRLLEHLAG